MKHENISFSSANWLCFSTCGASSCEVLEDGKGQARWGAQTCVGALDLDGAQVVQVGFIPYERDARHVLPSERVLH